MYSNSENELVYKSLSEIRLRKTQLLTDINKESKQISILWNNVFHKPKKSSAPTKKLSNLMSSSVSIADAAILGWKLYRRLNGKPSLFSFFSKKEKKK
ncbi:hypothetical protein [Prevotella aurantiaca]|jgi:hypothetical protein|uniref:hypothetical protein n=1 Tax=Prevotella aurantiaca TaxID=596085 RepID=UPI001CB003FE|nr:hypothetical protein [Prevotella aurantiaca]MBF1385828.1 hypothetical protein [Prevotella aurantiaca]